MTHETGIDVADVFARAFALQEAGRYEQAERLYRDVLDAMPAHAGALHNLGLIAQSAGRCADAIQLYEQALRARPSFPRAYRNLGLAHWKNGDPAQATAAFRRALEIEPDNPATYNHLGTTLLEAGRTEEAFAAFRKAAALGSQESPHWGGLFKALCETRFPAMDPEIKQDFIACLRNPHLSHQKLAYRALRFLRHSPEFTELLAMARDGGQQAIAKRLTGPKGFGFLLDPMLCALLERVILPDPEVERLLTCVRAAILQCCCRDLGNAETGVTANAFLYALSSQCFLNEYVYGVTEHEEQQVRSLEQHLERVSSLDGPMGRTIVAILGCYRSLHPLPARHLIEKAAERIDCPSFDALVTRQIREPLEEAALRATIPSLREIADTTSRQVRRQYEESPYPRWTTIARARQQPFMVRMRSRFPHVAPEHIPSAAPLEVLVAGCGTGQHALSIAARFKDARILAVDLSLSSLAYATRKARQLGFGSVEFLQADILDLGALGRRFDVIEAGGVLHHMQDPIRGWRVLLGLLKDGGWMKVGLYSELARRHVVKARAQIRAAGYRASLDDIRAYRQKVLDLPPESEIRKVARSADFYCASSCRDMLFHVQEHRFTLPLIARLLDELGLEFVGFDADMPDVKERYRKRFPDDPTLTSLDNWHRYEMEHPDDFWIMYQFWSRKPRQG